MHTSARTGFTFWAGEPVVSLRGASFSPSRRLLSHAAGAVMRAEALYYGRGYWWAPPTNQFYSRGGQGGAKVNPPGPLK